MKIRIRRLLTPVFFCLTVACLIEIPLGQTTIFGDAVVLWDTLFRAVIAVPVLVHFYREDQVFRRKERWNLKIAAEMMAAGAAASLLGNAVIGSLGISGYEAAEKALFAGSPWLWAAVLLAASPVLEELFFRGVFGQRLKEIFPETAAIFISALCFGVFHWNVPQGIYSFFMGLLLSFVMEKYQTVKAPILLHIAANGAAICHIFVSKM